MRLIDADELKKHIRRCDDSETRATFDFVYDDDIDDAPTVDVLDKIRDELHATAEMHEDGDYYLRDEWIDEYFDKYTKGE